MFEDWTARRRNLGANVEITGSAQDLLHLLPPASVVHPRPSSATILVAGGVQDIILRIPVDERRSASSITFQQNLLSESDQQPISGSTANKEGSDKMKMFKGLLVTYVFFALPLVLFFYPRYDEKGKDHQVLNILLDNNKVGTEKSIILFLFVIHVSVGLLAVLLAYIARGSKATTVVGGFTLWIIISILAIMDYILLRTLPNETIYILYFLAHFIMMTMVICGSWFTFVWPCCCCQGLTSDNPSGSIDMSPV